MKSKAKKLPSPKPPWKPMDHPDCPMGLGHPNCGDNVLVWVTIWQRCAVANYNDFMDLWNVEDEVLTTYDLLYWCELPSL